MTKYKDLLPMFAAGAALALTPPATAAETSGSPADQTAEVVVVGQQEHYRGDVAIKDLPQAVQVISGDTLKELNITRLDDALDLVSGAAHQNNFGGLWDAFAIRGF